MTTGSRDDEASSSGTASGPGTEPGELPTFVQGPLPPIADDALPAIEAPLDEPDEPEPTPMPRSSLKRRLLVGAGAALVGLGVIVQALPI